MADIMPDYFVEQQRVIANIASLNHNFQRQQLEIMEMDSRKKKTIENLNATKLAITDLETKLEGLIAEHGKAPEIKF